MNEDLSIEPSGRPQLDYLPVGLFGSVMGLTGLSVAWRLAEALFVPRLGSRLPSAPLP